MLNQLALLYLVTYGYLKNNHPLLRQSMRTWIGHNSIASSLMYIIVYTKPDMAHVVRVVSKYMSNTGKQRRETVKWTLWYLGVL